jgi:nicotinamide-nucleotide amidase
MDLEIVSIGNEVLEGHTVNTNAAFLSRELYQLGYTVRRHTVLPDQVETIERGLKEAMSRAPLVIATGGLGPTIDDLTRSAARRLFDEEAPLKNEVGTAPGAFFRGAQSLILLPGVPREMERMFLEEALPLIQEYFPVGRHRYRKSCSLCLLRELEVDPFLREMQAGAPGVEFGIYPSYGSLLIEFSGSDPAILDQMAKNLKERFPTFYFEEGKIALAVHKELIARKKKLAAAESCTGGAIAARLTAIPDSSIYFLGSLVVYSNQWKEHFLQVSRSTLDHSGAVSRKTVEEMVKGLFHETEADYAIAVSGIAGPSGGTSAKPVGTVCIAIGERGHKTDIGTLQAPKDRASAIEWTVTTSLGALWRRLVHKAYTFS